MRKLHSKDVGELGGGLVVQVTEEGEFEAREKDGRVVAKADTYKALVAEVRRVQREADREEFGAPEILLLVDGDYGDQPDTLITGTLAGVTVGGALKVKAGGKTKTLDSYTLFRADEDTVAEVRAAVHQANKLKVQLREAEEKVEKLKKSGLTMTSWGTKSGGRAEIVAEIKEALA